MTCSVCGLPLPEGARFCPNCGAVVGTLLGTEERKVVTVLFADLVNSTRLALQLDAERARDLLGRFFDAASEELQALRGRPEKFIGDAVMAVFGLPEVHEDDALRAVRAGLAIRARARRLSQAEGLIEPLEVRVGVESGEAAMGVGPVGQLLVTGPVVNVAARLQAAARPGQVLAGQTTHALTLGTVSFGRRRTIRAKGVDGALVAYPVEGLTARSARRTIPFVGRASEQAILGESLGLATSTGRPVMVTIAGEPGIGKTRLADELTAGLGAAVLVLHGQGRFDTNSATFSPAATIVGDLASIEAGDPPDRVRRRLQKLVEGSVEPDDRAKVAERLALLFGLGRRAESAFVHDVQSAFIALVDGLARDHPVVLVFEDVHTYKAPMLDLIERLAAKGRRGPRRALILALARTELLEERPAWGSTSQNSVLVRLDPLSTEESIKLVRQAGGGRLDDAQAAQIAERSGGNPYFIIETTGMLITDGSPSIGRAALPPTVQAVVAARLDHLPSRLRDLARRASAFIYSFDYEEIRALDPEVTLKELQQLEEAEILTRERRGSMPHRWRLRHATLRDVAYSSLSKRERTRLHQLIAEGLLAEGHRSWAADHMELAALASLDVDPNDRRVAEMAADALLAAGDRARRRMESRSAVDYYERTLLMAGPEEGWNVREARALAGSGESHYWLGEYPLAAQDLTRAVEIADEFEDNLALAQALRFLGDIAIVVEADVDKAERLLARSLAAAEALGDPFAIVRALLFAGWVPWTRERYEDAETIWQRALAMAEAKRDPWARVRALTSLSINRIEMSDPDVALQLIEEASALAEETEDQFSVAVTLVQKARVLEALKRYEEALPCFDASIAIFAELGARWELADARAQRGITMRELGRLDEAEHDLRYAIRISEELGERQMGAWTWRALARVAERRGDEAAAEELYSRSRKAAAEGPR